MAATEFTTLNRGWVVKMVTFIVVLVGFGFYGLYDATLAYPGRGYEDASYKKMLYLERCDEAAKAGRADLLDKSAIAAPDARHAQLMANRAKLEVAEKTAEPLRPDSREYRALLPELVDAAALRWLDSLALVGGLKPENTDFKDPAAESKAIKERWSKASPPKPLEKYDLPMQWSFTFIGFVGAALIVLLVLATKRKRFGWDPVEKRLSLPGGQTLTPDDIAEFDKRKWDKFYIFLHLKPSAGGGQRKLDLLRHAKLEGWVLEMERIAFPENAAPAEEERASETPAPASAASPGPQS
ncbi:MAG: hypothetical protein ACT4PL_06465 [Phycisphaerales bacterium]